MRLYPYYDQYGRPSGSQTDSHRPAYDSSGRKLPFDQSTSQNNQISNNYQYYDIQQQPPQSHPGYDEWLRNQYRQRGIIPRGYENNWNQQASNSNQDNQERNEVPAYVLQTRNNLNTNSEDGNSENDSVFYEKQDRQEPKDLSESENSRNSENGETYYSVNPGAPVNEEIKQIKIPGGDDSETVEVSGQSQEKPHVRFIKYHPPTVIRDKKGNSYERIVTDGIAHYFDASGNEVKIDDSSIDRKIEQILENRRRQEEKLRSALEDSDASLSDPVSAAEVARQG
nr:hypothetical protein M01A10.5 - Caenorhabditis elegans [Caenorhabditis elegans]